MQAALKNDKHLTIITCDAQAGKTGAGVKNFTPMGVYEIPEYTEQKLYYPPFLEMLDYCYPPRGLPISTPPHPGPIGLAALAIAKILKLPLTSTYHTQFPQYAQYLTGDDFIEGLTWKFMIWYYDQMDQIYVSSRNSFDELTERGIKAEKIRIMPRRHQHGNISSLKALRHSDVQFQGQWGCVKISLCGTDIQREKPAITGRCVQNALCEQ